MRVEIWLSFRNQRDVIRNIAAQMTGEDASLNERQLAEAQILIQQRMVQGFLFALLVGGDDAFAPGVGEFDRAAFAQLEIIRADLLAVDERDRQAVGEPRAKLFHQVQRQRGSVRAFDVQIADEGVQPDAGQRRDAIVAHEGVKETEQAVDAVPWRTARANGEGKLVALLFEQQAEYAEVLAKSAVMRRALSIAAEGL